MRNRSKPPTARDQKQKCRIPSNAAEQAEVLQRLRDTQAKDEALALAWRVLLFSLQGLDLGRVPRVGGFRRGFRFRLWLEGCLLLRGLGLGRVVVV